MSENKVNGPEDAIVSEMIKRLPMQKDFEHHEVFSGMLHGYGEVTKLVEGGEVGVLKKA